MALPEYIQDRADGVVLHIKLQPKASRNEISGAAGTELRIKVTAAPVDSAANEAMLKLLVKRLSCHRNQVEIVRGHTARHKAVLVRNMTGHEVFEAVAKTAE